MHPLENFESLTAILAETIARLLTAYCTIGGVALTVLLECHIDCSIRISRSFAKIPMAESDLAKTGLAGPLATALQLNW